MYKDFNFHMPSGDNIIMSKPDMSGEVKIVTVFRGATLLNNKGNRVLTRIVPI